MNHYEITITVKPIDEEAVQSNSGVFEAKSKDDSFLLLKERLKEEFEQLVSKVEE